MGMTATEQLAERYLWREKSSWNFTARDFLFGNSDNDVLTGNQWNQKDIRTGGSGSDTKHWNQTHVGAGLFVGSWNGDSICN